MTLLLAASLFFCDPVVPDLPRADAYLEENDVGASHLVDRFDAFDLWTAQRVFGRWYDDEGRLFTLAVFDKGLPPLLNEGPCTRVEFEDMGVPFEKDDYTELARAVQALVPVPIAAPRDWEKPHQLPRTCRDVRYCEGTNDAWIVAAYLPEKSARWQLAVWRLKAGDDRAAFRSLFEDEYLVLRAWVGKVPPEPVSRKRAAKTSVPVERELLRRDLVHSVTNYPTWRVTDSPDYVVLDDLTGRAKLIARLTNELVRVRADYARAVPSPIDGSNALAVARIYLDRADYLKAAGAELGWSAAYWCQERREIVAYLPEEGEDELVQTLRHEGFHQYLSYAGSMILAAPWINEGYAGYFEAGEDDETKQVRLLQTMAVSQPKKLKEMLVNILSMDYEDFYDPDSTVRAFNYVLAWSVAYFLEKGAPEVRFEPFKNVTRDYMKALLKTRDRSRATESVFTEDMLSLFVSEWLKFFKGL